MDHILMVVAGILLVLLGLNIIVWATFFLMSSPKRKKKRDL